ncbi:hypothetical protein RJ639_016585 [Escallonia herrerae]|uniref:Diacylglycerol kinase accessory domain-containing protein n=1 Tax=Escallonia herrerae TaxID=1293975 RepID=A0AA88VD03_9ASTE|nr:hypothetical protein RJ639_016585 [Escallonia herrerae]
MGWGNFVVGDGCERQGRWAWLMIMATEVAVVDDDVNLLWIQLQTGVVFYPLYGGSKGLKNILKLHVKKVNCSQWEQIPIPSSVRAIVALNLHNYGSGRHPWGSLKPEYMEKKGFVEAHADDGLLEIFGLKHGWHASFVMVELISAKHIAQLRVPTDLQPFTSRDGRL